MKLIDISYDSSGICRAVIEGDKGIEYITNISIEGDNRYDVAWCSCAFSVFHEIPCKHINFLMSRIDMSKMVDKRKELSRIPTGSKILDDLLGGGVPKKLVTTIFSAPMMGKSWCAYQVGVNAIKETGKDTLLIDTEGILQVDLKSIIDKLGVRFGVDEETLSKKFKMLKTYDDSGLQSIQKFMMMFGFFPKLELSDNGKYKVTFNFYEPTLTEEQLKNTSLIIIDSLTKPVKDSIGSETSNLPARAQIIERLFGKLYQIAEIYDIAIIVLHHSSIAPPIGPYHDIGHAYGGNPIYYNSKYILQFLNGAKPEKEIKCAENEKQTWGAEARRVILIRRPNEQATGTRVPIRLMKDMGFVDG